MPKRTKPQRRADVLRFPVPLQLTTNGIGDAVAHVSNDRRVVAALHELASAVAGAIVRERRQQKGGA
jgi:hypothetical protein